MSQIISFLSPPFLYPTVRQDIIFPTSRSTPRINQCRTRTCASTSDVSQLNERRSANYHPSIWTPKVIESFTTPYTYESYATRLEELKHEVRSLLASTKEPCAQMKLIDSMQRLGVAYHFQDEIKESLIDLVRLGVNGDLYTTALQFRLMREHGFPVSSGVFDKFRNEDGKFMGSLREDVVGLLSLYDASHLGFPEENDLEEAKIFSSKHLKSLLGRLKDNNLGLADQVQQALDVPLHWRMLRLEARNFINVYQRDDTRNLILVELAKLDYNLVQSVYHQELKELSQWWRALGFRTKLQFSRDRLMENYLWAMGLIFEPNFSKCRIILTKFVCILTAIDDIYDVYGSLYELELFTTLVKRWDIGAMRELPECMQICYFAMFNFVNELAYGVLRDEGLNILAYLREEWTNLCGSYLVEARWFCRRYTPTLEEYLGNAWISVGGPAAIVHSMMSLEGHESQDSLRYLKPGSELIYWSSLITRLSDDLGTSQAESIRGDVTKSMECYMLEEGASGEEAKENIEGLIRYSWKKLNKESENGKSSSLPMSLINLSLNMARTALCIFQYGDGIGTSTGITRDRLITLIAEPIPIE